MTHEHTAEEIADALRQRIVDGLIRFRQRVPTVGELADRWLCTKTTARQALRVLRHEGWIDGWSRADHPGFAKAKREVAAMRAAGLLQPLDRHAVGTELPCAIPHCRNLAVWVIRSDNQRFQVRPVLSCNRDRANLEGWIRRRHRELSLTLVAEPFQNPAERPSVKRKAQPR